MTLRKTFDRGDGPVAELVIEVRRLKAVCVKHRAATASLTSLGLRHKQHLPPSAPPALVGANPEIIDLQPPRPSPSVQTRDDPILLIAQENSQSLPVIATCVLDIVVVEALAKIPDIPRCRLCFEL
jgi:hypothetical protein